MSEQVTRWSELYRNALFESDRSRLPARLEEAQTAIRCRVRELFYAGSPETRERRDLDAALRFLALLGTVALSRNAQSP